MTWNRSDLRLQNFFKSNSRCQHIQKLTDISEQALLEGCALYPRCDKHTAANSQTCTFSAAFSKALPLNRHL